jgi:hypothetical protein
MHLYPLPHYLGLSSDVLVALTDDSITKIWGYHVPSSLHMVLLAFSAKNLMGKLCIPSTNSKGGHSQGTLWKLKYSNKISRS